MPRTRPHFRMGRHKAKSTNVSATGNDCAAGNGLLPGRVSNVTSAQAHARESQVECQAHKQVHDTHTRATVSQNVRMPAASAACASSQMSVKNKTCSGGTPRRWRRQSLRSWPTRVSDPRWCQSGRPVTEARTHDRAGARITTAARQWTRRNKALSSTAAVAGSAAAPAGGPRVQVPGAGPGQRLPGSCSGQDGQQI